MNTHHDHTLSETSNSRSPRTALPVVRATIVIGTIVALVASVGAPFKWY